MNSLLLLPLGRHYSVIYADPPWQYKDKRGDKSMWGAMPYPTLPTNTIAAMPISEIAAQDCVLFLWATMPLLPDAFKVLDKWGFKYVTCAFVWVKKNPKGEGIYSGLGSWTNQNAEICLLAKRGRPRRIARNVKQIIISPRGRHSAKPAEVRQRIVSLMGDVPRIELFARDFADGWDAWGNEVSIK